jgi:pyruvate,water dikinase
VNLANENMFNDDLPDETSSLDSILQALLYQLQSFPQKADEIKKECKRLQKYLSTSSTIIEPEKIKCLLPFLQKSKGDIATQLFSICELIARRLTDPWTFLEGLLSTRDKNLIFRTLDLTKNLVSEGLIKIDSRVINFFADKQNSDNNVLSMQKALQIIATIVSLMPGKFRTTYDDPALEIYLEYKDRKPRVLAARLLDLRGTLPSKETTKNLLGTEAAKTLSSYLAYTRATYLDLLYLIPVVGKSPSILESLQQCKRICGENIIREVIAKLGWKFVNYGLSVKHHVGVSFNGSLPLFFSENEAILFEKSVKLQRVSEFYLFTAHGGLSLETLTSDEGNKPVALFREYNLAHANLLQKILDIAPLTPQKVKKIIEQLDRIVDDFVKLFKSYSEECTILPEVYGQIKNKIIKNLEKDSSLPHLSADTTRLVQMFENPNTIGEVHTLHGLKRYLHQRGLQLGFKLVDQSKSPNQSVNLVLASGNKVLSVIKKINFTNFESGAEEEFSFTKIPYPIKVVTDGFERQLLHGQENFPSVNIFCYGNEIHYFVWFRNHPIFIRIDFSPPLQGGMIDLQYFGVSNYEIADHPNIYLDAIKIFFQFLEFDVKMDGTHIQARYDKERALDLNQLCERVEYLFCLVPYMMDLDWVIGSLNLGSDAKKKVARAWAELFTRWGVLPVSGLLTKDRLGILQDVLSTPEGEHELVWAGEDNYQDRYSIKIPHGFFEKVFYSINNLGLKISKFSEENFNQLGQIYLERKLLNYLREALAEDEIIETPEGLDKAPEDLFQRIHETFWFAEIISRGGEDLESSIIIAQMLIPLEQTLKYQTTGALESFKVQSSTLPLRGDNLRLYVLRDYKGIIRIAFFVRGNLLYQKRKNANESWKTNANLSPVELMSLLRRNNYTVAGSEQSVELIKEEIQKIQDELLIHPKPILQTRIPGEKLVIGLRASPGRATGRVLLGVAGRLPEDFDDHIFVAHSISPDENTILFHSAGIVATGGGILSHAGLIATQFNKPAIIISGKWKQESDGSLVLHYQTSEFQVEHKKVKGFNITLHYDLQEREYQMRDGDLVVLDANKGSLQVIGQERDTIALYEGLKSLGRINENLYNVNDVKEILVLRGKKLHIRHQIEKFLRRISEPVLARYAVQEIMVGNFLDGTKSTPEERAHILTLILQNDGIGNLAENYLSQTAGEIENKFISAYTKAEKNIPLAQYPFEVVMPRLEVFRIYEMIKNVIASLGTRLLKKIKIETKDTNDLNKISIIRLEELHSILIEKIHRLVGCIGKKEFLRHLFRQLTRINLLLNTPDREQIRIKELQTEFEIADNTICKKLADKFILKPGDGALELAPMVGWKAANLAELEMLGGKGLAPPWFVITDKAFQNVLETFIKENVFISGDNLLSGTSLHEAIDKIISRTDITTKEKPLHIINLWNMISLPEEIKKEVIEAYREIEKEFLTDSAKKENESKFYVAIRSSSCEEDAEVAARAGEFETYLFITGEDLLIEYLKRTWSGLWTERAIHNRTVLGNQKIRARGGVVVQRIVWSRVSGVLQTINVAKGDLREIVINAGLGLGEGIVSGAVAADQIIVSKEGNLENGPLHFNYITADKMEQVVFNKRAGFGTVLTPTLYHQRFRPALEYVELCELVSVASRLEAAYGYPLDIEFGIEGTKLWILQVRPIATFLPAFRETINNYPLADKNNRTTQE